MGPIELLKPSRSLGNSDFKTSSPYSGGTVADFHCIPLNSFPNDESNASGDNADSKRVSRGKRNRKA